MKLTVLSRYSRLGASSRLRIMQFLPQLRANGVEVRLKPFFADDYLRRLYSRRSLYLPIIQAYSAQIRHLLADGGTDLLWIEKEAFPWMPWGLEHALLPRRVPIVSDYDDAVFHRYDLHGKPLVRRMLGRKIDRVMAASALVTAGNSYLAERARAAGAPWIEIIPTVVDVVHYAKRSGRPPSRPPQIGWIGTPSTWTEYLAPMLAMLTEVAAETSSRVVAVGAGPAAPDHPLLQVLPWSEQTEVTHIQDMDIGIMPLTETPWAQGKCGYKLIQYMACGLPVVASPVGVNAEIVEHGVNGFLAATEAEWRDALVALLRSPDLRKRMGAAGRRKVEACYSLQVWGPRLAGMLHAVAMRDSSPVAPLE